MQQETIELAFARLMRRVEELETGAKVYAQSPPVTYDATTVDQAVAFNEDHDGFGE